MTLDDIRREILAVFSVWWNKEIGTDTAVFLNPNQRRIKFQVLITELTLRVADLISIAQASARATEDDRLHRLRYLSFRDFPHPNPHHLPQTPAAAYELGFRAALEAVRHILFEKEKQS